MSGGSDVLRAATRPVRVPEPAIDNVVTVSEAATMLPEHGFTSPLTVCPLARLPRHQSAWILPRAKELGDRSFVIQPSAKGVPRFGNGGLGALVGCGAKNVRGGSQRAGADRGCGGCTT